MTMLILVRSFLCFGFTHYSFRLLWPSARKGKAWIFIRINSTSHWPSHNRYSGDWRYHCHRDSRSARYIYKISRRCPPTCCSVSCVFSLTWVLSHILIPGCTFLGACRFSLVFELSYCLPTSSGTLTYSSLFWMAGSELAGWWRSRIILSASTLLNTFPHVFPPLRYKKPWWVIQLCEVVK